MKDKSWLGLALIGVLLLSACSQGGIYTLKLIQGGEERVPAGESLQADLILVDGSIQLEPDSQIDGSIYQILGEVEVDGVVTGNLSHWSGKLVLGPEAVIQGNLLLGSGNVDFSPTARVEGEIVRNESGTALQGIFGRDNLTGLLWSAAQVLLGGVLAAILTRTAPRQVRHLGDAIQSHPGPALAMGFLVGLVGITLLVQMAFTVILIPVSLLGLLVLAGGILFGWIAMGKLIGERLAGWLGLDWSGLALTCAGTGLLFLGLNLLNLIPVLGGLATLTLALVSLGGIFLTRFGVRQFQPAPLDP